RITNDVNEPPDRKVPIVLNGMVHAEEVLGTEFVLWLMHKMVENTRNSTFWRRKVDTYIIPTANPDGLEMVHKFDNSWRKTTHNMIGDGRFRFVPGWGGDTSGVDINRNFPLWWSKGDGFLARGANELYDYYRGPGPASEPETQAIINLVERVRPLYSVTFHSSRTGNVAEQVIYPWAFGSGDDTKFSPDIQAYDELTYQVASRCKKFGQDKPYKQWRVSHPRGDADTYLYYKFGAFGFRIEIGAQGIGMQPDSAGMYEVFDDIHLGIEYLLNSAARISSDAQGEVSRSRFDIYTIDGETMEPIEGRIALKKWITPLMPYRTTNRLTGRYFWLTPSTYNDSLLISKFGYQPLRKRVSSGVDPIPINIRLDRLERHNVHLNVVDDDGTAIMESVELSVDHPDSSWTTSIIGGGSDISDLPEGTYQLTFYCGDNYMPRSVDVNVESDTVWNVSLSPARMILNESFDDGDISYTADNDMNRNGNVGDSLSRWELTDDLFHSAPRCLTDNRLGNVVREEDGWCAPYSTLETHFDLSTFHTAALVFWLNQSLESLAPGGDSMWVEVWTSDSGWTQVAPAHNEVAILENVPIRDWNAPPINLQQFHPWERVIIPLDDWCGPQGSELHFRFHLRSDKYVETDGVYIDDVKLLVSDDTPPAISSAPIVPRRFELGTPYPNPFNGRFSITATLPGADQLELTLFDIRGRVVMHRTLGNYTAGVHRLTLDAGQLPTGLYLMRVNTSTNSAMRKVMLLK
ncbi:MAG: M14 family zinc carboxypeptidase, partial [Candidatus Electryoneaceae bacterium]|nr:M14 family zinc carboxypeptidase [Candidatus Electryoneaceae bacterium]